MDVVLIADPEWHDVQLSDCPWKPFGGPEEYERSCTDPIKNKDRIENKEGINFITIYVHE